MEKENNLGLLSSCSICKKRFSKKDVVLISRQEGKTILHATCSQCHTLALIVLSNEQKGFLGMGMITDLDQQEVKEKLQMKAISSDEIIDMYKTIEKF